MTLTEFAIDLKEKKRLNRENILNVGIKITEKYGQRSSRSRVIDLSGKRQVEFEASEFETNWHSLEYCMKIASYTLFVSATIGSFAIYDLITFILSDTAESFLHPLLSIFLVAWAVSFVALAFISLYYAKRYSKALICKVKTVSSGLNGL